MYAFKLASFAALFSAMAAAAPAPAAEKRTSGTATYFAAGLGACGWESSGSDWIVALTPSMYDNGSNCGKTVKVTNKNTGTTHKATVVDECPTCESTGSLDMSEGFFKALGGTTDEGVFPITWEWSS